MAVTEQGALPRTGVFWCPGADRPAATGTLTLQNNEYRLTVDASIADSKTVIVTAHPGGGSQISESNDPWNIVSDFTPRIVHGRLDGEGLITLLDAKLLTEGLMWPRQSFMVHRLIEGGHVPARDFAFDAVRVSLPGKTLWRGLVADCEAQITATGPAGMLGVEDDPEHLWIVFKPSQTMTVTDLDLSLWSPCSALWSLWTNMEVRPEAIQLRSKQLHPNWLTYRTATMNAERQRLTEQDCLLSPGALRLKHVDRWLRQAPSLGPIPFMAKKVSGNLQSDVLAFATALEGLHQRLYSKKRPMEKFPEAEVRAVTGAATKAGLSKAAELGWTDVGMVKKRFSEVLSFFDSMTYAQRVRDLAEQAVQIAPGLLGPSLSEWVKSMKTERNNQSHQPPSETRFAEADADRYLQLSISSRWVLHLCLLAAALDVDAGFLSSALRRHRRFWFDLANIDACEHGWGGSSLTRFREAVPTPESGSND